jgi:hypothetical protein
MRKLGLDRMVQAREDKLLDLGCEHVLDARRLSSTGHTEGEHLGLFHEVALDGRWARPKPLAHHEAMSV